MTASAPQTGPAEDDFPSAGTLHRLRTTLGAYVAGAQTGHAEAAVHRALDELAREARERRLHAERVLLALKHVWHELPETAAVARRRDGQRLLGGLVTHCIDVYYRQG